MQSLIALILVIFPILLVRGRQVGEVARLKCKEYSTSNRTFSTEKHALAMCEAIVMPLIIGGVKVDRTEFPHMAAIGYGDPQIDYLCGGSLISELFVLSAAHCASDRERGPAKAARLGSINLSSNDDNTQVVPIVKVIRHPDYKPSSKYHDIALMRLKRSVGFNEFIRPACINVKNNVKWSTAIATGFGLTSNENSVGSVDLLKVHLNRIDLETCQKTYKVQRFMTHGVIGSQFCAGNMDGGKDTCQGDSGGPLQILIRKPRCAYIVIGITSFGKSCGFKNTPAIYTNVANYTSWIEDNVWGNI